MLTPPSEHRFLLRRPAEQPRKATSQLHNPSGPSTVPDYSLIPMPDSLRTTIRASPATIRVRSHPFLPTLPATPTTTSPSSSKPTRLSSSHYPLSPLPIPPPPILSVPPAPPSFLDQYSSSRPCIFSRFCVYVVFGVDLCAVRGSLRGGSGGVELGTEGGFGDWVWGGMGRA